MAELKRLHPVWPTWIAVAGLALLFIGERLFDGASGARVTVALVAGAALVAALIARIAERASAEGDAKWVKTRLAAGHALLVVAALGYGVTVWVDPTASEPMDRLHASAWALCLVALSVGAAPLILLETTIAPVAFNPTYEARRVEHAWRRGLAFGLLVPVLFLANFVVERHDLKADLALGSVTHPSDQTLKAVRDLTEDVRVILFYPKRNEVARKLERYFEPLRAASPHFTVDRLDQALARDLAKTAKVSDNGYVVVMRGDVFERIRVGTSERSAQSAMRRFDSDFLKRLLQTTVSGKVAYFTTGHEERAFQRPDDDDPRSAVTFLADQLEAMQYEIEPLGLAQGLQSGVPDDADLVFVLGPERPLLPEELESLRTSLLSGGRIFVALDARTDVDVSALLAGTGLSFDPTTLADEQNHVTLTRSKADRSIIPTNGYKRHPSTETLARNRNIATLFRGAASIERDPKAVEDPFEAEITIESLPTTFADANGNYARDDGEPKKARGLMAAVATTSTTTEDEGRMVILTDVDAIADELVQQVQGNIVMLRDVVLWLQKSDDPVVTVDSSEDIKIIHRKEEDVAVFYGTTFGVPLLVLGLGWLAQRRRRS